MDFNENHFEGFCEKTWRDFHNENLQGSFEKKN